MSFEFHPKEQQDAEDYARANPVTTDEPAGLFTGIPTGIGMGTMRGGARAAKGLGVLGGVVPMAIDKNLGTDLTDRYFGFIDKTTNRAIDYWTPPSYEIGTVGRALGGLSEIALPLMAGGFNPYLLMASQAGATGAEMVEKGVDAKTARKMGIIEAGALGLGFRIPFWGATLGQKVGIGAGVNLGFGAGTTGIEREMLERSGNEQVAQQYDPWNLEARSIDLLMGAVFGGIAHMATRPSIGNVKEAKSEPTLYGPPEGVSLAQKDALQAAANIKHIDTDTAPGRPLNAESATAHEKALLTTIRQLEDGEPVNVAPIIEKAEFAAEPMSKAYRDDIARQLAEEQTMVDERLGKFFEIEMPEANRENLRPDANGVEVQGVPDHRAGMVERVITERGQEVETQFTVVEAQDLITSHDRDLRVNPEYPQELQPRDRSRAASEAQITRIENNLKPELLGNSAKASDGAPIIGQDKVVESGNARSIAINRAYISGKAKNYMDWLKSSLGKFNLPPDALDNIKQPVLVRVRKTGVNRAEFARQANESTVAGYSPTELAIQDARRINTLDGLHINEDGTINGRASMDFIRRFIHETVAESERPMMMDRDGRLSQPGLLRLKNAIFAKAYGDPELTGMLAESTDANIRNILAGMMRAAPEVARLREMQDAGARHQMSFSENLSRAAREFSRLRSEGVNVEQHLAQSDMFGNGITPEIAAFMRGLQDNARSAKRVAEMLNTIVARVDQMGDPRQIDMLGERPRPVDAITNGVDDMRARQELPADGDLFKSPEVDAARQAVEQNPVLQIADEVTGEPVSARVALDNADMDIELAKRDAPVFDALANCLIGR